MRSKTKNLFQRFFTKYRRYFGGACETQIEPHETANILPIADVMEKLRRFRQLLSDIACGRHEDMIKYKGGAINYEL